ncbi:MAG: coenzyme F420-0:L-glutamate ligase [Patescibacteria group bacterium]
MRVKAIKTQKVLPNSQAIFEFLDDSLKELKEGSIVVITSKVISLCEGRVVPVGDISREDLVPQESEWYLPWQDTRYGFSFAIKNNTLIPMAGIDESNANGHYVLWPSNAQKTANEIRKYLVNRFSKQKVGVLITDSTCMPMRWGTVGIAIGYSGFKPTNDYIGKPDLFGRKFEVSKSGVASGLAAAAVAVMGEGAEQTPIAVIEDVPFVKFQSRNPSPDELALFAISSKDDDLFAPFLNAVKWQKGGRKK